MCTRGKNDSRHLQSFCFIQRQIGEGRDAAELSGKRKDHRVKEKWARIGFGSCCMKDPDETQLRQTDCSPKTYPVKQLWRLFQP
ncbi:hypothetical protein E2C01_070838 [Portunus trituberculatus]|uniref:Uncharacterized protein n=1 Tax=Portunus trituberculatus TaxID=210409 RepID=A0A5B7I6E7_PORTR|nr:hypothetical protein [Portunus trituberculatus]